ncbi:hypothetical protein WK00_19100 [Burkholderia ubonensis]|nr:hypothetical protein WK00_19100 [Burkholderia ubonensis]
MRGILRSAGLIGDRIQFLSLQSLVALRGLRRDGISVFVDHHVRDVATYQQQGELINAAVRGLIRE